MWQGGRLHGESGHHGDAWPSTAEQWLVYRVPPVQERGSWGRAFGYLLCGGAPRVASSLPWVVQLVARVVEPRGVPGEQLCQALRFTHAVAFTACVLGQTPVADEHAGTRLIVRQFLDRGGTAPEHLDFYGPAFSSLDTPGELSEPLEFWEVLHGDGGDAQGGCLECRNWHVPRVRTRRGPHQNETGAAHPAEERNALQATSEIREGENFLTLAAAVPQALWPVTTNGPFGGPITTSCHPSNAVWRSGLCPQCHRCFLSATASRVISVGELIIGPEPPGVIVPRCESNPEMLVSFDGGARHASIHNRLPTDGPKGAGAGAALWGPVDATGRRQCLAQATISRPELTNSMTAEAAGLRLGLALAACFGGTLGSLGVLGDNLPVIRQAAANGRVRTPGVWALLEEPILFIAMQSVRCKWYAVRRRYNMTADALATSGTHRAVDDIVAGMRRPTITLWCLPEMPLPSTLVWHPDVLIRAQSEPITTIGLADHPDGPCP